MRGELKARAALEIREEGAAVLKMARRREPPSPRDLRQWLDLAAMGAICDVTELRGFNRALAAQGLKVMSGWRNPGLKALLLAPGRHSMLEFAEAIGARPVKLAAEPANVNTPEDLARALGVTRQSRRAALLDLTAEGLVERVPNRGARVRVVTADEAVAITECRMALEALCAVKAAQRITDAEAAQLR